MAIKITQPIIIYKMVESKYSDNVDTESSESNCSVDLPENCCPLVHQVAGHFYGQGRTKLGI